MENFFESRDDDISSTKLINVHLPKKIGQCFVDAPIVRSHRSQRPLSVKKGKPQPHWQVFV